MKIEYTELENGITLLKLTGQLDMVGFNEIDLKFTGYCAGDLRRVLVDLSNVGFMASIGIRMLTVNAKSLSMRGGRMVLLKPTEEVRSVLELTGIPAIIPMYDNLESAQAVLLAK